MDEERRELRQKSRSETTPPPPPDGAGSGAAPAVGAQVGRRPGCFSDFSGDSFFGCFWMFLAIPKGHLRD